MTANEHGVLFWRVVNVERIAVAGWRTGFDVEVSIALQQTVKTLSSSWNTHTKYM